MFYTRKYINMDTQNKRTLANSPLLKQQRNKQTVTNEGLTTIQIIQFSIKTEKSQPKNILKSFFGVVPVARYLAAISSALRRSSPRLASTIAFFSSASL